MAANRFEPSPQLLLFPVWTWQSPEFETSKLNITEWTIGSIFKADKYLMNLFYVLKLEVFYLWCNL